MKIELRGKKGRSTIINTVNVDDLSSEENLQELFIELFDFLKAMGAELPDEIIDMLEEYDLN